MSECSHLKILLEYGWHTSIALWLPIKVSALNLAITSFSSGILLPLAISSPSFRYSLPSEPLVIGVCHFPYSTKRFFLSLSLTTKFLPGILAKINYLFNDIQVQMILTPWDLCSLKEQLIKYYESLIVRSSGRDNFVPRVLCLLSLSTHNKKKYSWKLLCNLSAPLLENTS